jgi:two-component system chemotaxis response regulator CheY
MHQLSRRTPTRVLIVDDDSTTRRLLVTALRKECLVSVAQEGSEGYHKALIFTPDIVVIDVKMPGWDGIKTLEAFRAHPNLQDVKILMLTADASKETVLAALRGGAHEYLIKTSFSTTDFYKKLNRLVPGTISDALLGPCCPAPEPSDIFIALGADAPQTPEPPSGPATETDVAHFIAMAPAIHETVENPHFQKLIKAWP